MRYLVSIILPVYAVSEYIERCILSVIHQTYNCLECIIVDDASPDDSIEMCERMIAEYDGPIRFKIVHHERNRGLSAARNTGIAVAIGDYCFFLDSDDELPTDSIENLLRPILNDASIEIVLGSYARRTGTKIPQQEKFLKKRDVASWKSVRDYVFSGGGYYVRAWNRLIKRDFLIRHQLYFKEGLLYEDNSWSFFVLKHLQHLYVIPDVTYVYCRRNDSILSSTNKEDSARHLGMNYDVIVSNLTEGEKAREAAYYMKGFCYMCISHLEKREFRRIANKFKKALWEELYLRDWFILNVVTFMARFQWGRYLFLWAANKVRGRMVTPN